MGRVNLRSLSISTPKSFSSVDLDNIVLFSSYSCSAFRYPKCIILHLLTLNDIFHLLAQFSSACRSLCSFSFASSSLGSFLFSLGTLQYILLSSAKRHTGQFVHFGRSLMNMRNKIGPKTDPWGTLSQGLINITRQLIFENLEIDNCLFVLFVCL